MTNNSALLKFCVAVACVLGMSAGVYVVAQEDDDASAAKESADKKSAKGAKASDVDDSETVITVRENPVVLQLRESNPKTLDQLTRAIRITSQIGDIDDFQLYAQAWLKLTSTDADLAALIRKYGIDFFLELARLNDLQPEGEQVSSAVLNAAAKFARDPARLNDAITRLSNPSTQAAAFRTLREAGEAGVVALIRALADDTFKADRAAIRTALTALGRDTVEPLIAALSAPLPEVRADAATVLGQLKSQAAIQYLVGLASSDVDSIYRDAAQEALLRFSRNLPDSRAASKFLANRIRKLLTGEVVGTLDANDEINLWRWDDELQTVRRDRYPQEVAALVVANRLAKQLSEITRDPVQTRLALIVQLEADQTFAGLDQPLPLARSKAATLLGSLGSEVANVALSDAIALDRPTAIAAVASVLGATGRSELLTTASGRESPLVVALGYPDRRVQVAALKAILSLDSTEAFPGASRVVEIMRFLLTSSGRPRVLVGHPRFDESSRIGALYADLGYESDSSATGRALVRQALSNADYELILISETIDGTNVQDTVQTLRKDPRTARIPLGILEHFLSLDPKFVPDEVKDARDHFNDNELPSQTEKAARLLTDARHAPQRLPGNRAEKAALAVRLAVVVPSPQSPEALRYVHDQVMRLAPTRAVASEIRLEHAHYVLEQLAEILARKQPPAYYDFAALEPEVIAASRVAPLLSPAARVLGLLGTPTAQLVLAEQASLPQNSQEERNIAVQAFSDAVGRRGLYLTQAQIQRQYDRYESTQEESMKASLRDLLDVIEAPTAKVREEKRKLMRG